MTKLFRIGLLRQLLLFQFIVKIFSSERFFAMNNIFRGSFKYKPATYFTTIGAQVYNPIGILDNLEIVFDHDNGMSFFDQRIESIEQLVYIVK